MKVYSLQLGTQNIGPRTWIKYLKFTVFPDLKDLAEIQKHNNTKKNAKRNILTQPTTLSIDHPLNYPKYKEKGTKLNKNLKQQHFQ